MKNEIIEKVAVGLRKMKNRPSAFLFIKNDSWTWDEPLILGFKVYHSEIVTDQLSDGDFIPLWDVEGDYFMDRCDFKKGYEE
jgi:hypothetical protein